MKDNKQQSSDDLNQIFEIINAKGDSGEIKQIIEKSNMNRNDLDDEMK
ncbi:hypothetical protein [Metabacillus niabensis]|uniref:Uncharacterized protein n=1 Tax=Metabacillus niabensis TaxID=324854 RepID=A0ABT9Z217_9BACI|nr:hypothetical protein [Metabacillus niabensis]MDQ0226285.1 hypothetical protein [Metabacillus niabensis]